MNYHFITGSSRGLGLALTEALLERSEDNYVIGLARTAGLSHERYDHWQLDLADEAQLKRIKFPNLDQARRIVLVNNAGTLGEIERIGKLSTSSLIEAYSLNVLAGAVLINEFMRTYRDTAAAKLVINISSGAATKAYDGWGPYCSAKACMEMLTHVADAEQALDQLPFPFTLKSISPGPIQTEMQEQIRSTSSAAFSQVERFRSLATNNALPSPVQVAGQYLAVIEDPENYPGVVHRLPLATP